MKKAYLYEMRPGFSTKEEVAAYLKHDVSLDRFNELGYAFIKTTKWVASYIFTCDCGCENCNYEENISSYFNTKEEAKECIKNLDPDKTREGFSTIYSAIYVGFVKQDNQLELFA